MDTFRYALLAALCAAMLGLVGSAASAAPPVPTSPSAAQLGAETANPLLEEVRHRRSRCRWTAFGWVRWTKWGPVRCRPKFHPNIFFNNGGFDLFPNPRHCVKKVRCDEWGCHLIRRCY